MTSIVPLLMRHLFILLGILVLSGCAPVTMPQQASESQSSASSISADDGRILLTDEVYEDLYDQLLAGNCGQSLFGDNVSFADPTEMISYVGGSDYGFSAQLPFNSAWGTEKYAVRPYEEKEHIIDKGTWRWVAFGPVGLGEGCGVSRMWTIEVLPAQTPEQILEQQRVWNIQFISGQEPTVVTIGNHTVIRYGTTGFCDSLVMDVIGAKNLYKASLGCQSITKENTAMLEEIVQSMSFPQEL